MRPHSYSVSFKVGKCAFAAVYYGHPAPQVFGTSGVGCHDGDTALPNGKVAVKGSSVVWSIPLGGPLKPRAKLTKLTAYTEPGGLTSGSPARAVGDSATGRDWVIG